MNNETEQLKNMIRAILDDRLTVMRPSLAYEALLLIGDIEQKHEHGTPDVILQANRDRGHARAIRQAER